MKSRLERNVLSVDVSLLTTVLLCRMYMKSLWAKSERKEKAK